MENSTSIPDNANKMDMLRMVKAQRHMRLAKGYIKRSRDASTRQASELLIKKLDEKLRLEGSYAIGGTRTEARQDFWFHYTTTHYDGNLLLNLFVRISWPGRYIIKYIIDRNIKLIRDLTRGTFVYIGHGDLAERSICTTRDNQHMYLITYQFEDTQRGPNVFHFNRTVVIPIGIKVCMPIRLLNYYIRRTIDSNLETADFIIISNTNVKHRIHVNALEEHSSEVLMRQVRQALNDSQDSLYLDITDHEMLALTEFIYMNEIYTTVDFLDIVKLVAKFGLTKLYDWVEDNLRQNISYANFYEIAILASQNDWRDILVILFDHFRFSPECLSTFGLQNEEERKILKALLKYVYD